MIIDSVSCLNQVACFLKVQPGKIATDEDNLLIRTRSNLVNKGFINIILNFLEESESEYKIKDKHNTLINAQIWQWLEFCVLHVIQAKFHQNVNEVLKDLNGTLKLKTYLVSNKLTIADIVLYYILYALMCNLNPGEKELYMNVSRWFDNIQQDESIRQKNKLLNFKCNYVINSATLSHA